MIHALLPISTLRLYCRMCFVTDNFDINFTNHIDDDPVLYKSTLQSISLLIFVGQLEKETVEKVVAIGSLVLSVLQADTGKVEDLSHLTDMILDLLHRFVVLWQFEEF